MDYSKSGNPKNAKDSHHAQDLPRRGAPKDDRMKAAADPLLRHRQPRATRTADLTPDLKPSTRYAPSSQRHGPQLNWSRNWRRSAPPTSG
jgi:hypothetical protein